MSVKNKTEEEEPKNPTIRHQDTNSLVLSTLNRKYIKSKGYSVTEPKLLAATVHNEETGEISVSAVRIDEEERDDAIYNENTGEYETIYLKEWKPRTILVRVDLAEHDERNQVINVPLIEKLVRINSDG